ncbi:MAG: phosphoribosylglycinamide formyltransferase [Candidatus Nanopelagicales bacterium]
MALRVVVLASGTGSLFQALIESCDDSYQLLALVTDNPTAGAIGLAEAAAVAVRVVEPANFADREEWNIALAAAIGEFRPQLVVSAGFMRVLGAPVLQCFPDRIINTHPALLPLFPGAHAVRDALSAGVTETGSTVHVIDAGVDTGPVIVQEATAVLPEDDEASLHERIKVVERRLLVDVVRRIAAHGLAVHDRKVTLA